MEDEEPSEEGEPDLSVKNDWQEGFPRSKWIGNCTKASGPEDAEATNLFAGAQRQRACNPRLLEEYVGSTKQQEEPVLGNSAGCCFRRGGKRIQERCRFLFHKNNQ
jgi:hypothetical protein